MAISRNAWVAYGLALSVLVLDQVTKAWILPVPEQASIEVFWPLQFTRIWNNGLSFGLFQAGHDLVRWGMTAFNFGVAILLGVWALGRVRLPLALGFGLLMGGAVGNAIDRIRFGAVIDFIDVQRLGFFPWIFNVADAGITLGAILLLFDSLRPERPGQPQPTKSN